MPRNLLWDRQPVAEYTFWPRANSFRATMLLLALAEFHREHERYPESLTELVPTYFSEVPHDSKTGRPFQYFPHGLPDDVIHGSRENEDLHVFISKQVPFLMTSIGMSGIQSRKNSDGSWQFLFLDEEGKMMELSAALGRYGNRIWPLEDR